MADQPAEQGDPGLGRDELIKLAIDLGPLLLFMLAWLAAGLKWATGVIMVASVAAMIVSRLVLGRVTTLLLTSTGLAVVFGGLTLLLDDPRFVMVKPTVFYLLFASALTAGVLLRRPVLQLLLGERIQLTDAGWRIMSLRWAGLFGTLAVLNEIARLSFSEGTWVLLKVAVFPILIIVFGIAQASFVERHQKR